MPKKPVSSSGFGIWGWLSLCDRRTGPAQRRWSGRSQNRWISKVNWWPQMLMWSPSAGSPALHLHAVGRSELGNHETASGIDDYGAVPADGPVKPERSIPQRGSDINLRSVGHGPSARATTAVRAGRSRQPYERSHEAEPDDGGHRRCISRSMRECPSRLSRSG